MDVEICQMTPRQGNKAPSDKGLMDSAMDQAAKEHWKNIQSNLASNYHV